MAPVVDIRSDLRSLSPFPLGCEPSAHLRRKIPRGPESAPETGIVERVSTSLVQVYYLDIVKGTNNKIGT